MNELNLVCWSFFFASKVRDPPKASFMTGDFCCTDLTYNFFSFRGLFRYLLWVDIVRTAIVSLTNPEYVILIDERLKTIKEH